MDNKIMSFDENNFMVSFEKTDDIKRYVWYYRILTQ